MKCQSCGADVKPGEAVCQFCGSSMRLPETQPSNTASRQDEFERIKRSPEYQRRDSVQRHDALPKVSALAQAIPMAIIVVFIGVSGFIAFMAMVMAGLFGFIGLGVAGPLGAGFSIIPLIMAVVPIGFVGLGIFLFTRVRKKFCEFRDAPIHTAAAVIIGKRTQVSGGSGDSSATTAYFITVELEDGARKEFGLMTPDLYARVAEDDVGVLFSRATIALDFDRVGV